MSSHTKDFNERTNTFLYKNISRKGWCFLWCVRDSSHIFFREPGGANACTPLQARQRRPRSTACPSLDCLNLTAWFSSCGLLLVTHLLDLSAQIVLSCLLITTWQLDKAHGVTRNEPKIHGICYITLFLKDNRWQKTYLVWPCSTQKGVDW